MDFILNNWQWILGGIVILAIIGSISSSVETKKFLTEWNRLHAEKDRIKAEIDVIRDKQNNESSEPEKARLWLEQYELELENRKNAVEIAKLRIEIIKKKIKNDAFDDYCIKSGYMDGAEEYLDEANKHIDNAEKNVQKQAEKNLFYQCKKCNEPYARERISTEWLEVEYLGSSCSVEDTETITKKEEQKSTKRKHRIKMLKIYQCKYCDDKTDEIQDHNFNSDFWCCPECAKDDVIKELNTTEIGTFKTYREVTETSSRGEKTKQVAITKVREKTDYECSNCGHKFSRVNSRELK